MKICLTVITALHAAQTGASSFLKIKAESNPYMDSLHNKYFALT